MFQEQEAHRSISDQSWRCGSCTAEFDDERELYSPAHLVLHEDNKQAIGHDDNFDIMSALNDMDTGDNDTSHLDLHDEIIDALCQISAGEIVPREKPLFRPEIKPVPVEHPNKVFSIKNEKKYDVKEAAVEAFRLDPTTYFTRTSKQKLEDALDPNKSFEEEGESGSIAGNQKSVDITEHHSCLPFNILKVDSKSRFRTTAGKKSHSKKKKGKSSRCRLSSREILAAIMDMQEIMKKPLTTSEISDLSTSLEITYKYRFNEMYNQRKEIQELLLKYPALSIYQLLIEEFSRIYPKKNVQKLEREIKSTLTNAIGIFLRENKSSDVSFARECVNSYLSCPKEKNNLHGENDTPMKLAQIRRREKHLIEQDVQMACFVHNLTHGSAEKALFIYNKTGYTPRLQKETPNIEVKGKFLKNPCYKVYVEMRETIEVDSFYRAILSCYFQYWIFWLEYDSVAREFFGIFDSFAQIESS